ncbi:3-hydroxyacyl-CoA dehydrogenase family protein [Kaustia mangrovi]|uniref:3-hydroxyacyl-CoA dehydrogenase family protein n=1 Tax=Kaustia mangrovi TaxID=2593653 RepID=UPI001FE25CD3|nr:3-hydroxyacyl-CoA dehydrogenase family protein [Kaustia mangrovi]
MTGEENGLAIDRVAILGAGTMGHALALVHALAGCEVRLFDVDRAVLDGARELIDGALRTLIEDGGETTDPGAIHGRIHLTPDLAETVGDADLVIEAIIEDADAKRVLFEKLDALAPDGAIFASNTSYLDVFPLMPEARAGTSVVTHWYTPPYLIDLVDLVPGPGCRPGLIEGLADFYRRAGKAPLVFAQMVPGYVANRLQAALNLEILRIVEEGWASPRDVDFAIRHGLAERLLVMGHMRKMDFTGLDMVRRGLAAGSYRPPVPTGKSPVIEAEIARGRIGVRAGAGFYDYGDASPEALFRARDRKLLALRRFLKEQSDWDDMG